MQTATLFPPELLNPVPGELPSGVDLRFAPEWKLLEEAKRQDDALDKGDWATKEQKSADWVTVGNLARELLTYRSKDIRLAMFLLESAIRTNGFAALPDGLKFLQGLVSEFWNRGLHPEPDGDSFDDRSVAFAWMNEKLPDLLRLQPLTESRDSIPQFTFSDFIDARAWGREKDYEEGRVSTEKRDRFLKAKQEGRTLDQYYAAVESSRTDHYEAVVKWLNSSLEELKTLTAALQEKFGSPDAAPGVSQLRNTLHEILAHVETILDERPSETTIAGGSVTPLPGTGPERSTNGVLRAFAVTNGASAGDWARAEDLIRSGQTEAGIAEMTALAQRETSGRTRFQRKLLLADTAMHMKKDALARSILEELAEQIDGFKLVEWETTDVVGAVWTRLYRLYKSSGNDERAQQLYQRLCRVDPWQALSCSEE
jgi:type VI secretion system protein ImpA